MSVLTQIGVEIDRIETAKASIKAAIEGKGVSVPSDTKIDGMAALISNISSGGGGTGGNVGTCTVVIQQSGGARLKAFGATCFDGEDFYPDYAQNLKDDIEVPHTIANVACGTTLCVVMLAVLPYSTIVGGTVLGMYAGTGYYQITANPGETAVITLIEAD